MKSWAITPLFWGVASQIDMELSKSSFENSPFVDPFIWACFCLLLKVRNRICKVSLSLGERWRPPREASGTRGAGGAGVAAAGAARPGRSAAAAMHGRASAAAAGPAAARICEDWAWRVAF